MSELANRFEQYDPRLWENSRRREMSIVSLAAAVVLVVSGVVVWLMLGDEGGLPMTVLIVILFLLAAFQGVLHLARPPRAAAAEAGEEWAPGGSIPGAEGEAAVEPVPRVLTLKCGECATIFDLADPGTRPLYHTCPGCGAEGVLNTPPADLEPETPEDPAGEMEPEAAPAEERKPLRKLKLRCGACQTVFVVEDFGERPLRHECPGCGRAGELR